MATNIIEQAEKGYYRALGIRKEFPELNPLAALLLVIKTKNYVRKHHPIIDGAPLPAIGGGILTGNHRDEGDIYKALQAGIITAGRLTSRAVVKRSLVYRDSLESPEFLASLGNKTHELNDFNPIRAFVLLGTGVFPRLRDVPPDRDFIRQIDGLIDSGQLWGCYLQLTRYDDCLLRNLQIGAAWFARRHPDTPVYSLASSGPPDGPDRITVVKVGTYNEISAKHGRKVGVGELTIIYADMTAKFLPQRVQTDWLTRREIELSRLTPQLVSK